MGPPSLLFSACHGFLSGVNRPEHEADGIDLVPGIRLSCTCVPPYAFMVCTWRTLVTLLCLTLPYLNSPHLTLPYLEVTLFHKSHEPHICGITIIVDRPPSSFSFRSYGRNFTLAFEASPS